MPLHMSESEYGEKILHNKPAAKERRRGPSEATIAKRQEAARRKELAKEAKAREVHLHKLERERDRQHRAEERETKASARAQIKRLDAMKRAADRRAAAKLRELAREDKKRQVMKERRKTSIRRSGHRARAGAITFLFGRH